MRRADSLPYLTVSSKRPVFGRVHVGGLVLPAAAAVGLLFAPRVSAEVSGSIGTVTTGTSTGTPVPPERAQAAIYCQLLGPAVAMGLGFSYRPIDSLALDVSIGGFSAGASASGVSPAVGLAWLSGGGGHHLELGAMVATLLMNSDDSPVRPLFGPHLGYRYQSSGAPLFFRATLHGVVVLSRELVVPWPGLAFGSTWDT